MNAEGPRGQSTAQGATAPAPRLGDHARRLVTWRRRDRLREYLSYNTWVTPVVFAAAGLVLGFLLPFIDREIRVTLFVEWETAGATVALGGIVAGTIALVGFVYTVSLLVLQLQYRFSPRLIRLLARDKAPKLAVGVLIGTAVYSLGVLRAIEEDFVPQLSTQLALIAAALSVLAFLFTVGRLTDRMRTSAMSSTIGTLTRAVIAELYPLRGSAEDPGRASQREPGAEARTIAHEGEPGVIVGVDAAGLLRLLADAGATLHFELAIGEYVHHDSVVFRIDDRDSRIDDDRLRRLVLIGKERTFEQDPAFGFRLLVDMANAALSPAVNDPTTAVQALDELDDLLRMLAPRRLDVAYPGSDGIARAYYRTSTWEDYVGLACNEIRHYGADQPQIARRMRAMLQELEQIVPPERCRALEAQLGLLERHVVESFSDPAERAIAEVPDRLGFGRSAELGGRHAEDEDR